MREELSQRIRPELPEDELLEYLYNRHRAGVSLRRLESESGISKSKLDRKFKAKEERDRAAEHLWNRRRKWRFLQSNDLLLVLLCLAALITIRAVLYLLS